MARGMIHLPKEVIDINQRKAQQEREAKKILVPMEFLTALKRGQDGEQVLRRPKSAKGK